jgi:two-component system CheB/CheR fusion protein
VQDDAERVMRTLSTIERQVESNYNDARYVMRMLPYRTVDNVIAGVVITFVDVTKITAAEARITELTRDLRDRIQSLETLLNLLPVGILIIEDNRSERARVNRAGAQLLGTAAQGDGARGVAAILPLVQGEHHLTAEEQPLLRAARAGEAVPSFEGQLLRPDGSRVDVMMTATPLFDEGAKVRGAIAAIMDISERKRAEAQQQVLLHELQHRVKNIITTIGALASRMLKGGQSLDSFADAFTGRLAGMAKTHELLTQNNWAGTGLRPLVETTVRSYLSTDGKNFAISGPDLILTPNAAATLGMVLYELATNAAKYGAWSERGGRVNVSWHVKVAEGEDSLSLSWVETDGPAVEPPIAEGFGTGFIKRSVEYELGGHLALKLAPRGLRCLIEFPLRRNVRSAMVVQDSSHDAHRSR